VSDSVEEKTDSKRQVEILKVIRLLEAQVDEPEVEETIRKRVSFSQKIIIMLNVFF
jgi:hypothetical protein